MELHACERVSALDIRRKCRQGKTARRVDNKLCDFLPLATGAVVAKRHGVRLLLVVPYRVGDGCREDEMLPKRILVRQTSPVLLQFCLRRVEALPIRIQVRG